MIKTRQSSKITSTILSKWAVEGMQEKKAFDILVMDLRKIQHAMSNFFVICTGSSDIQIEAIADSVVETIFKQTHQRPWKSEGRQNREWVLLDYVDVVIHIFNAEKRAYYELEAFWGDAVMTRPEDHENSFSLSKKAVH